ncbi:alkyl sulfatase dimerization domain-containing protein [Haliea sp. E1-2-M8]|uniref:alkyl sulfatase dimerization domain-containing protein n=1 Tax=Haliea sp. E1-2-M8 TaxID=3064706 RepID=UPI0027241ED2|nr:alkyl sulfatase dimerization domain-containing protein [Haliea sp. E1-2-M8]MDO8862587.1 alkyl sulfatase dimerization domain-containing protein [Haliea sp. E1-2-M8]
MVKAYITESRRSAARMLASLCAAALSACGGDPAPVAPPAAPASEALAAHSAEFQKDIVEVVPGIHVAIGYALANVILIEGDDGVIIVDTTESLAAARAVKTGFERITDKPVAAIIYTHNHTDHIFGAAAFAQGRDVPVYAHATTWSHIERIMNVLRPVIETRSFRMFGNYLAQGGEAVVNDGIGPALAHTPGTDTDLFGLLQPTHTFQDRLEVTIAGRHLVLLHAPGETDDQILVWLPEEKVLLPGDNVYKAFPNLYTIRGTRYRDVTQWAESVRAMRGLGAEHLVPSHTRPVTGAARVDEILRVYSDAIQYVHDQTVRGINQGLDALTLAASIELPPDLAAHPWLQPFYGTVPWSVRAIYAGYLGWYDGNSSNLFPTPAATRASRLLALAGGEAAVLAEAEARLAQDPQWAAELTDLVLAANPGSVPIAADLKAQALRILATQTPNPNARNWYLTEALELEGRLTVAPSPLTAERVEFARGFPIAGVLRSMAVSLDPARSAGVDQRVVFVFPDQGAQYAIHVRNQVAAIESLPAVPDDGSLTVTVTASDWLDLLSGQRGLPLALADGTLQVSGGLADKGDLLQFLALFRQD